MSKQVSKTKYDATVIQGLKERWANGSQRATPFNQGTLGAWFLRFFGQRPWFTQFEYAAAIYGTADDMPEQVKAWHDGSVSPIEDCRTCPFLNPNGACRICNHGLTEVKDA